MEKKDKMREYKMKMEKILDGCSTESQITNNEGILQKYACA